MDEIKARWPGFTSKGLNSTTKTNKFKGEPLAPLGTCWRSQEISFRPLTQAAVHVLYSFSRAKAAQIPNTSLAKSGNKILWTLTTLASDLSFSLCFKHTSRPIYYGFWSFGMKLAMLYSVPLFLPGLWTVLVFIRGLSTGPTPRFCTEVYSVNRAVN